MPMLLRNHGGACCTIYANMFTDSYTNNFIDDFITHVMVIFKYTPLAPNVDGMIR